MVRPGAGGRRWRRRAAAASAALLGAGALLLSACRSYPPLPTVAHVDLPRFMGDWYVVAHIPASAEAEAYNAVESYRLEADGTIATTYAFRDGGFDGEIVVMEPSGVVRDAQTNATWGMQFFWPLRFEYLITYLDEAYATTIVGRTARDYAWIMARTPDLSAEAFARLEAELVRQGYDLAGLRRVPHRWPDPEHPTFAGK
jgi:apolipoprotein D and lipocalin family protein